MNLPVLYFVWTEYCQTSPNKNKSPNLWHITSILVCCIFDYDNGNGMVGWVEQFIWIYSFFFLWMFLSILICKAIFFCESNFLGIILNYLCTKGQIISKWFFWCLLFTPKNERKQVDLVVKRILLFVFWRKSMIPKNHFEIIWPLIKIKIIIIKKNNNKLSPSIFT